MLGTVKSRSSNTSSYRSDINELFLLYFDVCCLKKYVDNIKNA